MLPEPESAHHKLTMLNFMKRHALTLTLLGALCCLVFLRCWVFVAYSRAHFDSDQAVIGLMAKDLAEGRAWPVFTYGRRYMLALCAWLCAPLFAWFGPSVTLLKLPLVAMNLAIIGMLWVGLRREVGATKGSVALSILPFAVPGVVVSSRLVEQGGGNIEPFVLLLSGFLLRSHPLLLGVNFGIAFLNREFALIGLVALLIMDGLQGKLRERWRAHALTGVVLVLVIFVGRLAAAHAANYFGPIPEPGRPRIANMLGLLSQQLPVMIGGASSALQTFNITSTLTVGHRWLSFLAAAWLVLVLVRGSRLQRSELNGMSAYLVLVGGGQVAAYALLSPGSDYHPMLIRYTLLFLLALVGLVALALRRPELRLATFGLVAIVTLANLGDHAKLIHEYATSLPRDERETLAEELVSRGVHYAVADYWLAYHISFLTDERVIATSERDQRIQRYIKLIGEHSGEVSTISNEPCTGGERIASWYLCRLPSALRR